MTHFRSQHYVGLVTLKLVHIIARGVDNLPANFGVSSRFFLELSANTCQTHQVTLRPLPLTLEVTALVVDASLPARPFVYHV